MDINNIINVLSHTEDAKIIVFGDFTLDKYLYTDPENNEDSVETGIPAFQIHRKFLSAGCGGTITQNLRALGANAICVGLIGDDGEGYELLQILNRIGANTNYMLKSNKVFTCTYTKPMQKTSSGDYVELNRLDIRMLTEPPIDVQKQLIANLEKALPEADAVIIIDQFFQREQGAVTDYIRKEVSRVALEHPEKLFFADSRQYINEFDNMVLKCNNNELFNKFAGGVGDSEDLDSIIDEGKKIQQKTKKMFFVTRGDKGIVVFDENKISAVDAFKVDGPLDICGAGDATNASLVMGLVLKLSPEEAATLACAVSSITIQQIGTTGTATPAQVIERIKTHNK